jgi:hypothetical protein
MAMSQAEPPSELPATATPAPRPTACIYRWDLDKTYLQTEFDGLRALLRTAVEGAADKRTVPGAATLLRELRRATPGGTSRICFISGSPRQMRRVLTEKLRLDGVEFDEFILKPNLRNMLLGRFRALREQVGYKLPALLAGRAGVKVEVREVCFGDDAESDAFIYSLYGDLLGRRVSRPLLEEILRRANVYPDDLTRTIALFESLPTSAAPPPNAATAPEVPTLQRIFIHLDRRSPPSRFDRYGPRLVPIYNYFQAALVLYEDSRLQSDAVVRVAVEMADRHGYSLAALRNSLQDLLRRGRLQITTVNALGEAIASGEGDGDLLPALGALPVSRELLRTLARTLRDLLPDPQALPPPRLEPIDYLVALEQDLSRRK